MINQFERSGEQHTISDNLNEVIKKVSKKSPENLAVSETENLLPSMEIRRWRGTDLHILETSELVREGRILMYGNSHGLIFSFLKRAIDKGIIELPIKSILNVDYHADVATYNESDENHYASWQRYGVDKGLWSKDDSYSWQPDSSELPHSCDDPTPFIRSVNMNEAENLSPDVLSIDLDFFDFAEPENPEFSKFISVLNKLVKCAKCVFIFSSSESARTLSPKKIYGIIEPLQASFSEREEDKSKER